MNESFTAEKDKDATLDYVVDWTEWLEGSDTIAEATWTVPAGLTKVSDSHGTATATVWLSGGTVNTTYRVGCRVTTTAGRIDERTLVVRVVER